MSNKALRILKHSNSSYSHICLGHHLDPQSFLNSKLAMEREELKRIFQVFDRNGDGRITKDELTDLLGKLGISVANNKDLNPVMEKIDLNGDGFVDIEEFGTLYESIINHEKEEEEEDMKEAFHVFDQNDDGFITVEELKSVLASLGLKQGMTIEDCNSKVDMDGNGMVDFKEFKQMMG